MGDRKKTEFLNQILEEIFEAPPDHKLGFEKKNFDQKYLLDSMTVNFFGVRSPEWIFKDHI